MSNSKLVSYTCLSPNHSSRGSNKISKVTIHHMAGNLSVEACGNVFASPSRQASSNYGVGTDGRVGLYVDEAHRAWTSSSKANDQKAVTIEVANDVIGGNWHVSDKALAATIDLATDICERNGIKELRYTGDSSGNLTLHKMFAATNCPGPYLESKIPYIVKEVNERLAPAKPPVKPHEHKLVRIVNNAIYILEGPSPNTEIKGTVKKNEVFTIVDEKNGYGKLKSGAGWIWLGYTDTLKDEPEKFKIHCVRIVNDAIYVLKGPGKDYDIVQTIKKNEVFTIVDEKNGYGKLKSGAGWIWLGYTAKMQ